MKYDNYIALDLSKNSPGIVTYDGKLFDVYFFNHRKTRHDHIYENVNNFRFHPIDFIDCNKEKNRYKIYEKTVDTLLHIVDSMSGTIVAGIEDYSYSENSQATTKLAELKGIVSYFLYLTDNLTKLEIPIGTWKKFIYKGNASKKVIYDMVCNHYDLDLLKIFDLKYGKDGKIPKPLDDITDAIGIMMYMLKCKPKKHDPIGAVFQA